MSKCHYLQLALTIILIATLGLSLGVNASRSLDITNEKTDRFQYKAGSDGNYAIVGAEWHDDYQGAAYVFKRNGDGWGEPQKLSPPDLGRFDHFGSSVSINGDYIAVATTWQNLFTGAVYVFKRTGDEWGFYQKLMPAETRPDYRFGQTVSIDGNNMTIGTGSADEENDGVKSACHFIRINDRWMQQENIDIPAPSEAEEITKNVDLALTCGDVLDAMSPLIDRDDIINLSSGDPRGSRIDALWIRATDGFFEDRVQINWPDVGLDAIIYRIERNDTLISIASSDDTLYVDKTGNPGEVYDYCVLVIDMAEDTLFSGCDQGSRIIFPPMSMSASDGTFDRFVRVTWTDMSFIEAGYYVLRDGFIIDSTAANMNRYEDTTTEVLIAHDYEIIAFDRYRNLSVAVGDSGFLGTIMPPLNVMASYGEYTDRVVITWTDQAENDSGYYIYRNDILYDSTAADTGSYTDMAPDLGVEYDYCVATRVGDGNESVRICDAGGIGILPAPEYVKATDSLYDNRIEITWRDRSDAEDSFVVIRDGVRLAATKANVISYTDYGATPGVAHQYCISAISNEGGVSSGVCDSGFQMVVLAPFDVQATDDDFEDRVHITWKSNSTTAVLFKVFRGDTFIKSVSQGTLSYFDYGGVAGKEYEYRVLAVTALDMASETAANVGRRKLLAPTGVAATDEEYEDRVIITWTDNSQTEHGYVVRRTVNAVQEIIAQVGPNRVSLTDYTGAPGVTYVYSVAAFDSLAAGRGESEADDAEGLRALLTPTSVTATEGAFEDRVEITWLDNSYAEEGYRIYRDGVLCGSTGDNYTTFTDTLPPFGQDVEYRVVAYDDYGESEGTSVIGSTTLLPPLSVNASETYSNRVEIAWLDQSEIETGYEILKDDVPIGNVGEDITSFTDYTPDVGVSYEYCVRSLRYTGQAELVGSHDTPENAMKLAIKGDYAYIADNSNGLQVMDVSDPAHPSFAGGCSLPGIAYGITVNGDYAYVADYDFGLHIVDITNSTDPVHVNTYDLPTRTMDVVISGKYAYVATYGYGLHILNISDPANPQPAGFYSTPGHAFGVKVRGAYAYVADYRSGLCVVDISDPYAPVYAATVGCPGKSRAVALSGDYAFVAADSTNEIHVIGISDPSQPEYLTSLPMPYTTLDVYTADPFAYVAVHSAGLQIIDIHDPENPQMASIFNTSGAASGVITSGDYAYVADGSAGLQVLKIGSSSAPERDEGRLYERETDSYLTTLFKKIVADDPDAGDGFGNSVAIDGDVAVIGAHGDNEWYADAGAAYIFESVGDGTWSQSQKLMAAEPYNTSYFFGGSVAIDGDVALIGSYRAYVVGEDAGAAYIFERGSDGTWFERQKLLAGDPNVEDYFAISVAIDGDVALIGAYLDDEGQTDAGAAYIFERGSDGIWSQSQKLLAMDPDYGDWFGISVAIAGDVALIGAYRDDEGQNNAGAAYIFERGSNGTWSQSQKLLSSDPHNDDRYGRSVGISGDMAIVGAYFDDEGAYNGGAAFIYERSGNGTWSQSQKILANDQREDLSFGYSVGISGDMAVIGALSHALYIFERDRNGKWYQSQKVQPSEPSSNFGDAVAINDGVAIIGAPQDDEFASFAGAAFILSARVNASDGTLNSRVLVTWEDFSATESGYVVYRDGVVIYTSGPDVQVYEDYEATPGQTYEYRVAAMAGAVEIMSSSDYGWRPPDGNITGRVTTSGGAGVDSVSIDLTPQPLRSLLLDGVGGRIRVLDNDDAFNFDISTSYTVEGWFKFTGNGGDGQWDARIINKGDLPGRYPIQLTNCRNNDPPYAGRFRFSINDGAQNIRVYTAGNDLNDGGWHHIACVHDAAQQEIRIYKDGELQDDSGYTNLGSIANKDPLKFGGDFYSGRGFGGQIDEVRIWNVARSDSLIKATMTQRLNGDETGLVAYWPLDDGGSDVMTNYAGHMLYGKFLGGVYWVDDAPPLGVVTDINGNYAVNDIRYGTNTTFEVRPRLGNRQFSPAFKSITLGPGNPIENQIDFIDISSYTISGIVRYANTGCAVPDVQILVDDEMQGVTDKNGIFAVSTDEGTHTIDAVLEGHMFTGDTTIVVEDDVSGINFSDESTGLLTGRVGGGCGRYVGDVRIIIRSENNCLFDTLLVSDSVYAIALPPQMYLVTGEVVEATIPDGMIHSDVINFFTRLGERAADFAAPDDTLTMNFVYRAPLQVMISGFPEPECEQLTFGDRILPANLPVIPQRTVIPLVIEVNEFYGYDIGDNPILCPLDSGIVQIYDEIFCREDSLITLEVRNGEAVYTTYTAVPSLVVGRLDSEGNDRSFQKMIRATAVVAGRTPVSTEEWVLITGHVAPVGSDFVTFSALEQPYYILRDPPGDYSYAYLEEGYSLRRRTEYGNEITGSSNGARNRIRFGIDIAFEVGFIASTSTPIAFQYGINMEYISGNVTHHEWSTDVTVTMEDRFSTSADELFVGEAGDVFIGAGYNLIFAEVGVVDVGGDCEVTRTSDLGFQPDSTYTIFAYTQQYIQDVLIEDLKSKVQYYENAADPDSTAIFQMRLDNWQWMLDFNDSLKAVASIEDTNRSFSSGAEFSHSFVTDISNSTLMTATCIIDDLTEITVFDAKFSGMESALYLPYASHTEEVKGFADTTESTSIGVGYVFSDNNIGDHFTMDITYDSIYPTPIFDVLAGVSSCPYEPWPDVNGVPRMMSRDSAILRSNTPASELLGVPPDEPAVLNLSIENHSPTGDTRIYELREVSTSNPGGAIISANGVWLYEGLVYYIEGGVAQEVTLTVQRGPTRYDYDSLAVMVYPQCEWDIWERRTGGPLMHSDTLWFNVSFEAPCSDITLFRPETGWIFDKARQDAGDSLEIILNGYDLEIGDKIVTSVGVEYRRLGTGNEGPGTWVGVPAAYLDSAETIIKWLPPMYLADGVYELRAYSLCDDGGQAYSSVSTGTIDRHAPLVFGAPEPADSQLSLGENIRLTFNEPINCQSVTDANVSLKYLTGPDADSTISIEAVCNGNSIIILPADSVNLADLEGQTLEARVSGITDLAGNPMETPVVWSFVFRQSVFTWSQMTLVRDVAYLSPGEISAVLANGSSQEADFNIDVDSLPAWITAVSPQSGNLASHDTVRVTFTIREDIEISTYEAQIKATSAVVQNDAVLDLYLTVSCHEPIWSFNPEEYEYSMTLVAMVNIDGGMTEDTLDRVAAFVGGQLRGVASVEPGMIGSSVIFMTVYSNRISGETMRFQVWDASECFLYSKVLERYAFTSGGWIGTPRAPVTLTATDVLPDTVQVIPLSQGWNWFSTYVHDANMEPNVVLSDLTPQAGDILKSQTVFAEFDPEMGWVGSLVSLDNLSGYMINLSEPGTIYQEGSVVDPDTTWIPVYDGWNWVSYLPTGPIAVATALQSLNSILADGDIAQSQELFAQYAIAGEITEWFGNLDAMEPGEGYKLYLANGDDLAPGLKYPNYMGSSPAPQDYIPGHEVITKAAIAEEATGWNVDHNAFRYNMTLVGALNVEGRECISDDILVGAFVDGECRGLAQPIYLPATGQYELFLMIHSNEVIGESIEFQAYVPDERVVYNVYEVLAYEADKAAGTVREPVVLKTTDIAYELSDAIPLTYSLSQNYPNPFNPATTIDYALAEPGDVKLSIYNILGETIRVLVDAHQDAGYYSIIWDGKNKSGGTVATGIYFYHIAAGDFVKSKKMLLLK